MAYDGEDAVRQVLAENDFVAVVLDLVLPKLDGMEVLRTLRNQGLKVPVIIVTAKPRATFEHEAKELGVEFMLAKPLDYGILIDLLKQVHSQNSARIEDVADNKATGKKYPFRIAKKSCYICGYDKVNVYLLINNGIHEDWSHGAYPVYSPLNGYENWDGLKTMVAVCPYCLFASADPTDFADRSDAIYPYNEESKKILARSISFRKRLVPEAMDIDPRFDDAHRNSETVTVSLILAEKCCNGLILGGKVGAYCQAGMYTTMIGALQSSIEKYREALVSFENQLKHKDTPRRVLVKTYFFCIVLNMLLSRTSKGRDIMKSVELLYLNASYEEISEEEQEWLMRINHIWKAGIGSGSPREIV